MQIPIKMTKVSPDSPSSRRLSALFEDGLRSVDFVLAYRPNRKRYNHSRYRELFETELKQNGLQLEYDTEDDKSDTDVNRVSFVKVHASWEALTRQAEFLRLQMPIMENDIPAR